MMKMLIAVVCFSLTNAVVSVMQCGKSSWWTSFDSAGVNQCDNSEQFITGIYRTGGVKQESISNLELVACCRGTGVWVDKRETLTVFADWAVRLDHDNTWALCPDGFFLQGLYRGKEKSRLHNIEEGVCSKPAAHPIYYGDCIKHSIGECMKNQGWCKCPDNYYVAGFRRGPCDALHCLDYFMCCKMAKSSEPLVNLLSVQNRVMDITLKQMARLANFFGFAWAHGCRSNTVGQDFQRNSHTWSADKSTRCSGTKNQERLEIAYEDWSFENIDVTYGKPLVESLKPEAVDGGELHNSHDLEVIHNVSRTLTVGRSVSHINSQTFKTSHDTEISVAYKRKTLFQDTTITTTYNFKYERGKTQEDSTGHKDEKFFSILAKIKVKPNTALRWRLLLFKSQTSVKYKAKILIKFSASFKGYLRTGDKWSRTTNYHNDYRREGNNPSLTYKFGGATQPFYRALKEQSHYNILPWLWVDLKLDYQEIDSLVAELTDENRYTFDLEGTFMDVSGTSTKFYFENIPLQKKFSGDLFVSGRGVDGVVTNDGIFKNGSSQVTINTPDPSDSTYRTVQVLP